MHINAQNWWELTACIHAFASSIGFLFAKVNLKQNCGKPIRIGSVCTRAGKSISVYKQFYCIKIFAGQIAIRTQFFFHRFTWCLPFTSFHRSNAKVAVRHSFPTNVRLPHQLYTEVAVQAATRSSPWSNHLPFIHRNQFSEQRFASRHKSIELLWYNVDPFWVNTCGMFI